MNNTKYTKSARKFLRMVIKGEKKKKKRRGLSRRFNALHARVNTIDRAHSFQTTG